MKEGFFFMKAIRLDDFIEDRIQENKELFTQKELECIKNHHECVRKIYLLGFIHGKECYEKQD